MLPLTANWMTDKEATAKYGPIFWSICEDVKIQAAQCTSANKLGRSGIQRFEYQRQSMMNRLGSHMCPPYRAEFHSFSMGRLVGPC